MKKSGWVQLRKVKLVITWERIFLSLRDDNVLVLSKAEDNRQPKDVMKVTSTTEVSELRMITITGKKYCFEVKANEQQFVICVESEEDLNSWVRKLEMARAQETDYERMRNELLRQESNIEIVGMSDGERIAVHGLVICSYNLNYALCEPGTAEREEASNMCAMLSTKADIIFLQETNANWAKYMATSTTILEFYKYYTFHPDVLPAGGIAVLSRFPITDRELIQSPVGWFPAQLVTVHTPVKDIQVLNLHLKPPLTAFPNPLPLPHAYVISKKERVKECLLYSTYVDLRSPLVVLGDFNEDVSSESVKVWTNKLCLKNAYDTPKRDDSLANNVMGEKVRDDITWNWPLPLNITLKAKFDHIFYHGMTCTKYGVKLSGESDHYPIFANFKFL